MPETVKNWNSNQIELAAKFQVIWDSPGISLEPYSIDHLKSFRRFIDKYESVAKFVDF